MDELDDATRQLAPGRPAATGAAATSRPLPTLTRASVVRPVAADDALRRDEIARVASLARLMLLLMVFGIGLVVTVDVDATARAVLAATVAITAIPYAGILYFCTRPARYTAARVGVCAQLSCVGIYGLDYVFGPYSAAPMATVLPLFAYALGGSFAWTFAAYLHNALGHLLMGVALGAGWIEDRAIVQTGALSVDNQLVAIACVQSVLAIAFVLARRSRAKTVAALVELESAVRQVAERDALLSELHHHLDVAAGLGGAGRFTDHVIGSFRLGAVIGRGGMGEVYEATHVATGAPAAVKMLGRGMVGDPDKVARFLRELEIARTLSAPNVAQVLEVGDPGADLPYLAMERLRGEDLAEILRQRRALPAAEVAAMVRDVARALDAAHGAGIVHRDLKPSNVFRHEDRIWKVLDFGISKLGDTGELTRNAVIGTPAYMAPEQARGDSTDARADVYALAAIAYRALTGASLFGAADVPTMLYLVAHRMPARPGALAALPADVDAALAIGLAKDAADRFRSASELADALDAAIRGVLAAPLHARASRILADRPWGGLASAP